MLIYCDCTSEDTLVCKILSEDSAVVKSKIIQGVYHFVQYGTLDTLNVKPIRTGVIGLKSPP